MRAPTHLDLTRQWTVYIPQRMDGSGVVGLHMTLGNMQYFKLDKFPSPKDHGISNPSGNYKLCYMPIRQRGSNNGNFRLAYAYEPGRQKPRMCRFRLSGDWRMETLMVITDYLNSTDVEWLHIANESGNKVWGDSFSSTSVWGGARDCS